MLFSFSIDIWSTTVCTPDDVMVQMRGKFTPPPTDPHAAWMNSWKKPTFPLPYLIPYAHKALPNILSSIPPKNTSALSCKASCGTKQPFQYLALNLLCVLLLLLLLFPLLSSVPFTFLTSFFILFLLFLQCLLPFSLLCIFFPFYASFPQEKGRCFTLAQPQSQRHGEVSWRAGRKHCSCLAVQGED